MKRKQVDPHNTTVLEWSYARTGSLRKAMRVTSLVEAWAIARTALEVDHLTVDEYAAWWKEARSTAYKHVGEFREVFGHSDVDQVVNVVQVAREAAQRDRLDLSGLAAA